MLAEPRVRVARWVAGCLLALVVAAPAQAQDRAGRSGPPIASAADTAGAASGGVFAFFAPTADEQAQLMTAAMVITDLVFGLLGAEPTEEEFAAAAEAFYNLLLFLTTLQKLGAQFGPGSP